MSYRITWQKLDAAGGDRAQELAARLNAPGVARTLTEDRIEFVEKERVGHGENPDDHGTHLAQNSSKNQSLEFNGSFDNR